MVKKVSFKAVQRLSAPFNSVARISLILEVTAHSRHTHLWHLGTISTVNLSVSPTTLQLPFYLPFSLFFSFRFFPLFLAWCPSLLLCSLYPRLLLPHECYEWSSLAEVERHRASSLPLPSLHPIHSCTVSNFSWPLLGPFYALFPWCSDWCQGLVI